MKLLVAIALLFGMQAKADFVCDFKVKAHAFDPREFVITITNNGAVFGEPFDSSYSMHPDQACVQTTNELINWEKDGACKVNWGFVKAQLDNQGDVQECMALVEKQISAGK